MHNTVINKLTPVTAMLIVGIILVVWQVEIVVMDWIMMALCEVVVFISVMSWSNGLVHIMVRPLNEVGIIVVDWLNHDSLVMSIWVDKCFLFVMDWFLQVHLFTMNWIRPVMLNRSNDINKMDFADIPVLWVLKEFMLSLWHVVVV